VRTSEHPELGEILVAEADLQRRIIELGAQITSDYGTLDPLLVGILKGAFVFMSDLVRCIDAPLEIDFMAVSSYGSSTRTSGIVRIVKDLDLDLVGRHVLLVEDIVDSGLTLSYLRKTLSARNPASLEVCALLVRESVPQVDLSTLRYVGFRIPDEWVVGYGLDAGEQWRHLRDVRAWHDPGAG
jgi:hypoxanthine phosphoribosyltransferase